MDIPYYEISVQEESVYDCHKKISQWMAEHEEDTFTVNLTCGTKIMAIAAYEFFKDYGSRMIYIPIPKNEFVEVYPFKKHSQPQVLSLRLGVVEYLTAYSLKITNEEKLTEYKKTAEENRELTRWIVQNYNSIEPVLIELYRQLSACRGKKQFDLAIELPLTNQWQRDFLKMLGFNLNGKTVSKKLHHRELRYLTGGWLKVQSSRFKVQNQLKGRGIDDVVINVEIENLRGNRMNLMSCLQKKMPCTLWFKVQGSKFKVLGALQKEFNTPVRAIEP